MEKFPRQKAIIVKRREADRQNMVDERIRKKRLSEYGVYRLL